MMDVTMAFPEVPPLGMLSRRDSPVGCLKQCGYFRRYPWMKCHFPGTRLSHRDMG